MIGEALLLALAQAGAAAPVELPKAFNDALEFDRQAYYQICGNARRLSTFRALQARAQGLSGRYWHDRDPDTVVFSYVDRRAVGRCAHPERFEKTARDWNSALDQIEIAMGRAH